MEAAAAAAGRVCARGLWRRRVGEGSRLVRDAGSSRAAGQQAGSPCHIQCMPRHWWCIWWCIALLHYRLGVPAPTNHHARMHARPPAHPHAPGVQGAPQKWRRLRAAPPWRRARCATAAAARAACGRGQRPRGPGVRCGVAWSCGANPMQHATLRTLLSGGFVGRQAAPCIELGPKARAAADAMHLGLGVQHRCGFAAQPAAPCPLLPRGRGLRDRWTGARRSRVCGCATSLQRGLAWRVALPWLAFAKRRPFASDGMQTADARPGAASPLVQVTLGRVVPAPPADEGVVEDLGQRQVNDGCAAG